MTRWGFDRGAGRKRRPDPLVRRRARMRVVVEPIVLTPAAVSVAAAVRREPKIDLSTVPSSMEQRAASWRRG